MWVTMPRCAQFQPTARETPLDQLHALFLV
jgi:hypothetical protein